ncbi:glycosyltransferase family 4 protein [Salmonella enterica subsp. enterica serovar Give]|uniref:Glycosyltransferase family 4 protein n=1 Tax=Salmonella enterica subsp. enterica serovar Give TaxID=46626 RepID=A0A8E7ND97_SALET|nr:glycosyltransferase family 4 protein [Salmonella enterica]EBW2289731.1 glycosyltransferase family 1 protein [Salmonella enterica subsp. enterica serovar Newport]EDU9351166.1 glycosyltransferase family 4 protein [Salmonella enterica subsp. enterica]EEP8237724.1 glycosyltransferase family 4 protein [Salmonella enterica subsp. enterica serovar Chester]EAA9231899.1 glycosyltransferase family 1 protein [Salmonella enterica]EAM8390653.1 glycosyltransferase family 1 protein [Salmonella enterica]
MNILYTESSPDIGGQELQAIAQMQAMTRAGHQVVLACRADSRIAEEAEKHAIKVIPVPFRNSLHPPSVYALRRLVRRFCPEIVICHSGHDSNIVALTRATLPGRAGRFCIIRQKTYLTRRMRMFSLNHLCDFVVVPGREIQQALAGAGCRRHIGIVPPGFDFKLLRREYALPLPKHVTHWLSTRETAPVIVQAGMLRTEKGHDFMLDVLSQMKREGHRFYWLIAGAGRPEAEEKLRKAIVCTGMDDCALMCGRLSPLAPIWQTASLMVMPSRNESFGMAVVEAAACGVPVMASDTGGIPEIIRHGQNGTLLPPDNREAWLDALRAFFSGPEPFREMAARAEKEMEERFDIAVTVQTLLSAEKQYRQTH